MLDQLRAIEGVADHGGERGGRVSGRRAIPLNRRDKRKPFCGVRHRSPKGPGGGGDLLAPQAWRASSAALSVIVADIDLIADLPTFYGRIEDLQWRLRYRIEPGARMSDVDNITEPLAGELKTEGEDLLDRVQKQIDNPSIQRLGLVYNVELVARVATAAAIAPVPKLERD
jgi:hypothetical protein